MRDALRHVLRGQPLQAVGLADLAGDLRQQRVGADADGGRQLRPDPTRSRMAALIRRPRSSAAPGSEVEPPSSTWNSSTDLTRSSSAIPSMTPAILRFTRA